MQILRIFIFTCKALQIITQLWLLMGIFVCSNIQKLRERFIEIYVPLHLCINLFVFQSTSYEIFCTSAMRTLLSISFGGKYLQQERWNLSNTTSHGKQGYWWDYSISKDNGKTCQKYEYGPLPSAGNQWCKEKSLSLSAGALGKQFTYFWGPISPFWHYPIRSDQ